MHRGAADTGEVIAGVAQDATTPAEFADAVMDTVSDLVPFDGYCLFGTDPLSGVRTFMYSRHGLDGLAEQLAYNEFVEVDANRYRELGSSARPIGVMSTADSQGRRSSRMHDMLRPAGFGSELRLVLRSGWVFGGISLFREAGARPFGDSDLEQALTLAGGLRRAVQRHPVRPIPAPRTTMPTGVILLNPANHVLAQTAGVARWLDELCIGGDDEMMPADHMRMVLDVATASRTAAGPVVCRTRTASGRWLIVEAAPLNGSEADTTIMLRSAEVASLLPAAVAWFGLTPREYEVLAAASMGLPAKHIARDLALAVPTVNAHLQSIYRKAGVTGREQLLASLS